MKKTILTYGLLSGAVAALLLVGTTIYFQDSMDSKNGVIIGYAGILLSALFVYFGVRQYRDQESSGTIGFGKAFQVGILITLISCVCYVIAWLVVYETLMPDSLDKYIASTLDQMRVSGASEQDIQQETAKMEEYKTMYANPFFRAALTFMEPFPVGLLVTLISAFILSRNPSGKDRS